MDRDRDRDRALVLLKVDSAIQRINHYPADNSQLVSLTLIRRIVIYPLANAIHPLNKQVKMYKSGYRPYTAGSNPVLVSHLIQGIALYS